MKLPRQFLMLTVGLSGSGKSSRAWVISEEYNLLYGSYPERHEADSWFIREDGEYRFDPLELSRAHSFCLLSAEFDLRKGVSVIVSNTFTRRTERKPYVELALKYQIPLIITDSGTEWSRDPFECHRKNQHGLPLEAIQRQLARWEHVRFGEYKGKELEALLRECQK